MYSTSHHRPLNVVSRPSHRSRSSSDPFQDPIYTAPHIAYTATPARDKDRERDRDRDNRDRPPPVPAKSKHQYAAHARQRPVPQYTDRPPRMEVAVRDPVKLESRSKVSRSQTGGVQIVKPVAPTGRRSYSQDSATPPAVMKPSNRTKSGKKNSTHADVIDRLDFTGVGPTVVFHHDGPFDACAPSRNRHKSKAPMAAWSAPDDDPMSAAELRQDRQKGLGGSPYDSAAAYDDHYGGYVTRDNKQVDRIAEAWGIHEPEPYEEFFGGGGGGAAGDASAASSIRGGYETHTQNANGNRTRHQLRETYTTDSPPVRKATSRVPPPVPLNLPGGTRGVSLDASMPSPPLSGSPGAPKRSKSLMQKIRRMRDQPNIPADAATASYADGNPSPPSSSSENYPITGNDGVVSDGGGRSGRPTHRSQNSFFGRLAGRQTSANPGLTSPSSEADNHYVYVEKNAGKALPARPIDTPAAATANAGGNSANEKDGYFDNSVSGTTGIPSSPNGVTRKTSILRKVKGAVRGAK